MMQWARLGGVVGLVALSALSACVDAPPVPPPPVAEDLPPPPVPPVPVPPQLSAASQALAAYYARLQADLLAQGLLRGDASPADAPFTDAMLARDFVRIALFDEYVEEGGDLRPQARISRLRRWEGPVRVSVEFGPTIPAAQQTRDRASVGAYVARLARLTGHSIRQTGAEVANFHVLFLNEEDRLALEPRLRALAPGIADASIRAVLNMPRSTYCLVVGFSEGDSPVYAQAIVIIRGEHPDLMRLACIHEEIAQGLGLVNDSPEARPTIFNDNEEFGLLTVHDEMLLKILYDPRLTPGMTAAEAAPIARQIAAELLGGEPV